MTRNLSPKDLASVIGVSESSLKRWVDEGRLTAVRTAGGHRRIALHEAIRFIRDTGQSITRPELLGLVDLTIGPIDEVGQGHGETTLLKALQSGHAEQARGIIMAQHIASRSFASVCDGPIAHAMHRIGELWRHDQAGIMIEHRALEIVLDAIHQIRSILPPPAESAPVALGCSVMNDPYTLPTFMAATTLLEIGYRDVNFGANLPMSSLIDGIRQHEPRLVWVSVSTCEDREKLFADLASLSKATQDVGAIIALGGRALCATPIPAIAGLHYVSSMTELGSLGKGLKSSLGSGMQAAGSVAVATKRSKAQSAN